ncbi:MAG: hypothetical protein QOH05_4760 [Acetobacteraceae bacterium]|jgi:hypothetical protein|nr:hypothetical protein [Acetobacteraceae bacterium]
MGRKAAAPSQGARAAGDGLAGDTAYYARWPFSAKNTAAAVAVMTFLAVVAFGVIRLATTAGPAPSPAVSRIATPPRPAFTRAEEAYVQALWPIHGEVERSSVRVSLGNILYKTDDLGKADLKARIDAALATYRRAEARIGALQPPPSLAPAQDDYLAAVRLYQQSAVEALKMFEDGNDDHLLAAHPLSQAGSNKIREIGVRFWQDEFPPN